MTDFDQSTYDRWLQQHPQGNVWQSMERKKYMEACGKEVTIEIIEKDNEIKASALIVKDTSRGGTVWEIPRGPIWSDENSVKELLKKIVSHAKKEKVMAIYVSPITPLPSSEFGWKKSNRKIHATATRIVDLTQSEEEILKQMHQKGRYNIRIAEKGEVTVRKGDEHDIDAFYELLQSTGGRDGFVINQKSHYSRFIASLEGSFLLVAEHENRPVSGLIGVIWNGVGIYYYGASSYEHRALMAPYLLQWEAMKYCKEAGCKSYDLLGIENPSEAEVGKPRRSEDEGGKPRRSEDEGGKPRRSEDEGGKPRRSRATWQGISDFKRKFGGEVVTYPSESVLVLKPIRMKLLEMKRKLFG